MRLAHLHLPGITPFRTVSQLQQILALRQLAYKKAVSSSSTSTPAPTTTTTAAAERNGPDPTIITFTPNPVYTTGRRDLPPSNTFSPSDTIPSTELSLPPSLEPIRSLLTRTGEGSNESTKNPPLAEFHPTLRGGQTTYHGPGQLVAYTILDLRRLGLSPRCHISLLEKSVIDLLSTCGVKGFTTADPGVWVNPRNGNEERRTDQEAEAGGGGGGQARKITAVGVHLRRHISSFGIGLNVTQEPMWFFKQIVPCGLEGKEATSLEGEGVRLANLGKDEEEVMAEVAERFVSSFIHRLKTDFPVGNDRRREGIDGVYKIGINDVK